MSCRCRSTLSGHGEQARGHFRPSWSGEQLDSLPALMDKAAIVVMNAIDWQIIPAENMVSAFQDSSTALYATASTATDAQAYLEAVEKGTDGVVLHTADPSEVLTLQVGSLARALFMVHSECFESHLQ